VKLCNLIILLVEVYDIPIINIKWVTYLFELKVVKQLIRRATQPVEWHISSCLSFNSSMETPVCV